MQVDNDILEKHLDNIRGLQSDSGLFLASHSNVSTGYNKAWLRDNFYTCLAFEEIGDWDIVKKVWKALLSVFIKHKNKISWASKNKPYETWQYIHARYHPETFEEFWEEWGNKQNDAVGAILFKIGNLEERGIKIIETDEEKEIMQILVEYLGSIEYWHDPDNGVWEEGEEVHASSIGACVAGLKAMSKLNFIKIPHQIIENGEKALQKLLPRESKSKFVDLAQLSLVYPFNIVSESKARDIVRHIEYHLERNKGIIRYKNDRYYNKNDDGFSEEAEWCFGFSWLSIIYRQWAEDGKKFHGITDEEDDKKANEYLEKAINTIYDNQIPELYYSDSDKPNENTPLGWAESLFIIALLRAGK
ncbi:MAG: glycoside hydrolase family 15 [Candidatus Zambryskibacteria bacterium]|nr:glycoside hydrolase family 15 [Candidatus Zambryskibacteria bacterium]